MGARFGLFRLSINGSDRQRGKRWLNVSKEKRISSPSFFLESRKYLRYVAYRAEGFLPYACTPTETFDAILPPFSTACHLAEKAGFFDNLTAGKYPRRFSCVREC